MTSLVSISMPIHQNRAWCCCHSQQLRIILLDCAELLNNFRNIKPKIDCFAATWLPLFLTFTFRMISVPCTKFGLVRKNS